MIHFLSERRMAMWAQMKPERVKNAMRQRTGIRYSLVVG